MCLRFSQKKSHFKKLLLLKVAKLDFVGRNSPLAPPCLNQRSAVSQGSWQQFLILAPDLNHNKSPGQRRHV